MPGKGLPKEGDVLVSELVDNHLPGEDVLPVWKRPWRNG